MGRYSAKDCKSEAGTKIEQQSRMVLLMVWGIYDVALLCITNRDFDLSDLDIQKTFHGAASVTLPMTLKYST